MDDHMSSISSSGEADQEEGATSSDEKAVALPRDITSEESEAVASAEESEAEESEAVASAEESEAEESEAVASAEESEAEASEAVASADESQTEESLAMASADESQEEERLAGASADESEAEESEAVASAEDSEAVVSAEESEAVASAEEIKVMASVEESEAEESEAMTSEEAEASEESEASLDGVPSLNEVFPERSEKFSEESNTTSSVAIAKEEIEATASSNTTFQKCDIAIVNELPNANDEDMKMILEKPIEAVGLNEVSPADNLFTKLKSIPSDNPSEVKLIENGHQFTKPDDPVGVTKGVASSSRAGKKKSLNDMLRKLAPDFTSLTDVSALPEFLQKETLSDKIMKKDAGEEKTDKNGVKETSNSTVVPCVSAMSPPKQLVSNGQAESTTAPAGQPPRSAADMPSQQAAKVLAKGLYRCMVAECSSSFNQVNDLKLHISAAHEGLELFPCSFCFQEFSSLELMSEHLSSHIMNVMKCLYCQVVRNTREELLRHLSSDHLGQPKKINICVKILNNERGRKPAIPASVNASTNPQPDTSKDCAVETNAQNTSHDETKSTAVSEPQKSRNRKSAKPVKTQNDLETDFVQINRATDRMVVKCEQCSFTCNSDVQLHCHVTEGHLKPANCQLFKCRQCKMSTDSNEAFKNHMVHHEGNHVVRYYVCPYCSTNSSDMNTIEDHVGDKHPSEAFRFEVLQEKIDYMQDMLQCPICKGAFPWKSAFLQHVEAVHRLDKLSSYLNDTYADKPTPENARALRSLFRNILPDAPDYDYSEFSNQANSSIDNRPIKLEKDVEGSINLDEDESESDIAQLIKESLAGSMEPATTVCVQRSSTKDGGMILRFQCDHCDFFSNDYDKYSVHLKIHNSVDGDKSGSLIKKLLSNPANLPMLQYDSDPDMNLYMSSSSELFSQPSKRRSKSTTYNCHLCPFECNKTVHFRRHLAIHERNENLTDGYKCGYCHFMHFRLNCIKFHLGKYHSTQPYKMIRIIDGVEINLDINYDPSSAGSKTKRNRKKNPQPFPQTSTPVLRTENEKRFTPRYELSLEQKSSLAKRNAISAFKESSFKKTCQNMTLSEFEQNLPMSMIYTEPIKCPRCEFSNRVRINLVRHLKLHREENEPNLGLSSVASSSSCSDEKKSELQKHLESNDKLQSSILFNNSSEKNQTKARTTPSIVDEKPLLRSILCEKPLTLPVKMEVLDDDDVKSDESDDGSTPSEEKDPSTLIRANVSKDYLDFSIKLPNGDQYQCKQCTFIHRFPSKVKRHFFYKHTTVLPYKCGHCAFAAVESGKVKRHCQQMHKSQPEVVIKRNVLSSVGSVKVEEEDSISETVMSKDRDDVKIIDETVNKDAEDGHGNRWLTQFVTKLDNNIQCCKLCGYQQEGASSLKPHVYAVHLKFYPFSCNYCGIALMEICRVKKHIETNHPGMPLVVVRRHFEEDTGEKPKRTTTGKVSIKTEPAEEEDDEAPQLDFYPKSNRAAEDEFSNSKNSPAPVIEPMLSNLNDEEEEDKSISNGLHYRRQFKCYYCGIVSKWNRRDIRLHILHVHMKRRVYTCRHCIFGNSKSKAIVKSHCAKYHPNKPVSVRDDVALFNAIIPIDDKKGIVTMALSKSSGGIVLELGDSEPSKSPLAKKLSPVKKESVPMPLVLQKQTSFNTDAETEKEDDEEDDATEIDETPTEAKTPDVKPLDLSGKQASSLSEKRKTQSGRKVDASEKLSNISEKSSTQVVTWKCRQCEFIDSNVSRVKYHIICDHMKLKAFSCPHCHIYISKKQAVVNHIEKYHPSKSKQVLETVDEKAGYLQRNMEKVEVEPEAAPEEEEEEEEDEEEEEVVEEEEEIQEKQPLSVNAGKSKLPNARYRSGFFCCQLCGYRDPRNDKTKYHIIKQHLNLRQFSCPYCKLYMWGRQQVMKHIEEEHPDKEVVIQRTFQEYEEYLKNNIKKISRAAASKLAIQEKSEPKKSSNSTSSKYASSLALVQCNKCSFVTDSEISLAAHKRSHRMFQCFHCDFKHMLAARVQSHCLTKHPNKLVKYKQLDTSPNNGSSRSAEPAQKSNDHSKKTENVPLKVGSERTDGKTKKFHPCDTCPAHFETELELKQHASIAHSTGTYICPYCHIVKWNKDSISNHLKESHPDKPLEFKLIKANINDQKGLVKRAAERSLENGSDNEPPNKLPKLDVQYRSSKTNEDVAFRDGASSYKCKLCSYKSGKVTVMRHHIMSHLRYHPYLCPYCDVVRSVKSFPITKHVRGKHPGKEIKFLYCRNEEIESQIKNNFYRMKPMQRKSVLDDRRDNNVESQQEPEEKNSSPSLELLLTSSTQPRKVLYKCKFCSLKTHIRTDMKHHLMREIHYKPFKCKHCPYTEPCKWSMRKHFRIKHNGIEVKVTEHRIPEKDDEIEKILEECTIILRHSRDPELLGWKSGSELERSASYKAAKALVKKPGSGVLKSNSEKAAPVSLLRKPVPSTSIQKHLFKSSTASKMAIKFHRCPHCAYTNTSLKLVRGHMVKHGPYRLQCGYCDYRGHYPSRIRKHTRRHHPGLTFKYTKVNNPTKDTKPETIPVVHMPRSQKQPYPSSGTVFLDGVAMNMTLTADADGWYRCQQCDYQSVNREHFKMHVVIHRPPKWKCFYCSQKYPVIFRLRRHCSQKHPNVPIKWIDIESGNVCIDNRPGYNGLASPASNPAPKVIRATARKSTSASSALMRLPLSKSALFKGSVGMFQELDSPTGTSIDSDDANPFVIGEPFSLRTEDIDTSSDDGESSNSGTLNICCHLCPFKTCIALEFGRHLQDEHINSDESPSVEILPSSDDSDILALRRCSFCPFETYVMDEFEKHVRTHVSEGPLKCAYCSYASFSSQKITEHCYEEHPDDDVSMKRLDEPYTMVANEMSNQNSTPSFDAVVELENIMEMSEVEFDAFLDLHDAFYDRNL